MIDKEEWERLRQEAKEEMAAIWPDLKEAREKLRNLENEHGHWQAQFIEAGRHLVEVVKVKPTRTQKGDTQLITALKSLPEEERQKLVETLQTSLEDKVKE